MMKEAITSFASRLGLWRFSQRLIPALGRRKLLAVFTFHRISANPADPRYLARYDRGSTQIKFRTQLQVIQQLYQVIGLDEFLDLATKQSPVKRHTALLTFDDADSEFHSEAFPVLKELQLPAVMFAPTAYIGSERVFWHLQISNAFNHITDEQWSAACRELPFLAQSGNESVLSSTVITPNDRRLACQRTIWMLDKVDEDVATAAAETLESFVGCEYTLGIKCMNWDQLAELQANGIAVESHTANHPKLTRIDGERAHRELAESKLEIERRLNKRVIAICYPGGHFDANVISQAAQAGYRLGFTTRFGFCRPKSPAFQLLAVPRFDMRGDARPAAERYLTKLVIKY